MRIAIISDAWFPQVNGVVRTLSTVTEELRRRGHDVFMITPDLFASIPCPGYAEIRLSLTISGVGNKLREVQPDAVHIAVEGPLGWAARSFCRQNGWAFTTAYHTKFPEYLEARIKLPSRLTYKVMRHFHGASSAVMVSTQSVRDELSRNGIGNLKHWTRGVDTEMFHPGAAMDLGLPRPVWLYVGRVSVEKNIEDFLALPLPGSKVVVGDGPQRKSLARKYGEAHFAGARHGHELVRFYASSDVFVFPSRSDTYGLVMLEALACGTPVAAYDVTGPTDVITSSDVGCLSDDLLFAARGALAKSRAACREFALANSWAASAEQFLANLVLIKSGSVTRENIASSR